jgi:hypothetical protein
MLWLHTAVGDANAEKPTLKNTNIGVKISVLKRFEKNDKIYLYPLNMCV